jgi:hypothetical protein
MKIEFPQIHSFPEKMNPIEHSQRLKLTIIRMKTLFTKKNIKINSDSFIPNDDIDFSKATFKIENHIGNLIREYVKVNDDDKIIEIVHYIHFWGGITGRNIYVKNGGFDNNFNLEVYKKIVHILIVLNEENICKDLKEIQILFKHIPNIGISYASKHMHFWSKNANQNNIEFPILDSIIANGLFITKYFAWRHYCPYVIEMRNFAKENKTTISILERELYNYFNINKK